MGGYRRLMQSAGLEGVGVRLIPATLIFLFTVLAGYSFAQNNQSESLSIKTFYPAPYGVYKNPRLVPGEQPLAGSPETQAGTMYFNQSQQKLFIYNDSGAGQWEKVDSVSSSGSSGLRIYSGHHLSPDVCYDPPIAGFATQICDWDGWYQNITFSIPFNSPPNVIVTIERSPDVVNSPCASNMTDTVGVVADKIKTTGFRIMARSSPHYWSECGHSPYSYEGHVTRAEVGWIAIGK